MDRPTFLITGGTTGIGLATAHLLAADGARIIITGRNRDTLAAAEDTLPAGTVVLRSDSASLPEAQALGTAVARHTARLDGVFLNAGIARFAPFESLMPGDYEMLFGLHVRGRFFELQSLLPLLGNPSTVVLNAATSADLGLSAMSLYAASMAATVSLGRSLAVELSPRGIRVNTLSPGPIATPIFDKLGVPDATRQEIAGQTLLKRFGTADEVAHLARFLLTSASAYIVGENIVIDGGIRLT